VLGDVPGAWASLREGLAASAAPDLAHERGFLMAVRARLVSVDLAGHESVELADHEASAALDRLGVVRAPLPWLPIEGHG
jgi:hypothetical protein